MTGETIELHIAGQSVRVTNPDKVFFSSRGETKLDLINYYLKVAEPLLEALGGRPTLMQRFPDGARGKSFFQKRVPKGAPEWLHTTTVQTVNGTLSNALVLDDMAHVAWAVNMGCLGFHQWPYKTTTPGISDELRIDLDPMPGTTFEMVSEGALETRVLLSELGVVAWLKTSGSRGLHVYVRLLPKWDSTEVRSAAVALARELERRRPDLFTSAWWKEERGERIFVDFNQNAPHKTVFGAWSVRSRVGAQVSTPVQWEEVDEIDPDELTVDTVPDRMAAHGDPWHHASHHLGDIEPLIDQFWDEIAAGRMDAPWPPVYPKQPLEPPRVAPSRAR